MKKKILTALFFLGIAVIYHFCVINAAVYKLNNIANKLMFENDYQGAVMRLVSILDLDKNNYSARYNLAVSYQTLGDCEKALGEIEYAQELGKKEPAVYSALGSINQCIANQVYNKADKSSYSSFEAQKELAKRYVSYLRASNSAYDKFLELVPNSHNANSIIATISSNSEKIKSISSKFGL